MNFENNKYENKYYFVSFFFSSFFYLFICTCRIRGRHVWERGLAFQDAMLVLKMTFKNMFFPRRERKYRDDGTHNVVENEEENSINASFHCSAMRQLFRTDRVYSYLHVDTHDCKIANFYFHSLFYSKLMFARCDSYQIANISLFFFNHYFLYIMISLCNLIIFY